MVFDRDGTEVAHLSTGFSVALDERGGARMRCATASPTRCAFRFRAPGGYQVRFAVRDQRSGKYGTAGEFLDIADIADGKFALSGIVLRNDGNGPARRPGVDRMTLTPSQAVRVYHAGRGAVSTPTRSTTRPGAVQSALSIWRGIEPVFRPEPDTLKVPAGRERRFAAAGELKLGALTPGAYVLQITAVTNDTRRPGRKQTATQRIAFDVR